MKQKIFAIIVAISLFVTIIELIRRKKLREEYSMLWFFTGLAILILALWERSTIFISRLCGVKIPVFILLFTAFLFLIFISLHFSVRFSKMTDYMKDVVQRLAILESLFNERNKGKNKDEEE